MFAILQEVRGLYGKKEAPPYEAACEGTESCRKGATFWCSKSVAALLVGRALADNAILDVGSYW